MGEQDEIVQHFKTVALGLAGVAENKDVYEVSQYVQSHEHMTTSNFRNTDVILPLKNLYTIQT